MGPTLALIAGLLACYDTHAAYADHAQSCTMALLLDATQLKLHLARHRTKDGNDPMPM